MLWVLKRNVLLRRFFRVPITYVFIKKLENYFLLHTFFRLMAWHKHCRAQQFEAIIQRDNQLPLYFIL